MEKPKESMGFLLTWEPFDPAALYKHVEQGKIVFLDFTADWCLTCKLSERTALSSECVIRRLGSPDAVAMRADWTKQNPAITEMLKSFRRSGVPLDVIFPAHRAKQPVVLPEILTEATLLDKEVGYLMESKKFWE